MTIADSDRPEFEGPPGWTGTLHFRLADFLNAVRIEAGGALELWLDEPDLYGEPKGGRE